MSRPLVYIDGKEGTTGLQIYDRLACREDIELLPRKHRQAHFYRIYRVENRLFILLHVLVVDRWQTARLLGFDGPCSNSLDGVSDRDYAVELLSALSVLMMHLRRSISP